MYLTHQTSLQAVYVRLLPDEISTRETHINTVSFAVDSFCFRLYSFCGIRKKRRELRNQRNIQARTVLRMYSELQSVTTHFWPNQGHSLTVCMIKQNITCSLCATFDFTARWNFSDGIDISANIHGRTTSHVSRRHTRASSFTGSFKCLLANCCARPAWEV